MCKSILPLYCDRCREFISNPDLPLRFAMPDAPLTPYNRDTFYTPDQVSTAELRVSQPFEFVQLIYFASGVLVQESARYCSTSLLVHQLWFRWWAIWITHSSRMSRPRLPSWLPDFREISTGSALDPVPSLYIQTLATNEVYKRFSELLQGHSNGGVRAILLHHHL